MAVVDLKFVQRFRQAAGTKTTSAGDGNLWRSDGTFMQKAAGGYIDTKTGRFVPAQ
jgi:hypothetical protein